jgi:hypothetical protein
MRKVKGVFTLLALLAFGSLGFAQDKTNSSEKAKLVTPVKIQVVLSEYDGERKITNLPYSFLIDSEGGLSTPYSTFMRVGVRVPVPGGGKEGQTSFVDVGSNIDCGVKTEDDGRFTVRLSFERSSLYFQGRGDEKGTIKTLDSGQPYIPTIRAQSLVVLKDGQTLEALTATDPLNGHVFRINVTLNVQK